MLLGLCLALRSACSGCAAERIRSSDQCPRTLRAVGTGTHTAGRSPRRSSCNRSCGSFSTTRTGCGQAWRSRQLFLSRPSCQPSSPKPNALNRHTSNGPPLRNATAHAARRQRGTAKALGLCMRDAALSFVGECCNLWPSQAVFCALTAFGERQCRWAVLHDQDSVCRPEDTVLPATETRARPAFAGGGIGR